MAQVEGMGTAICKRMRSLPAKQSQHPAAETPFVPYNTKREARPFETIAMDWITKLPPSNGYDSILTIMDHNCSKAVLFIPCKEAMGTKELVRHYFNKVFPHYGIPGKIISDRDLWLTSHLAKQICKEANIDQKISTAYHLQTDGQLERTNQTLETFLRIFYNKQQDDWAQWLPLAQYVLNARPSHTTKVPPFKALIGVIQKGNATPAQPSPSLVS